MATVDDEGNRVDPDTLVETSSDQESPDQSENEVDISTKTFRYNPPLHKSNLSKRVDFGTSNLTAANFYDEDDAPTSYAEQWAKYGLKHLRLGRIIQHHIAPGQVSMMDHRWGFRFLYNPSSVSYVSSRNDSFIIDPRSETNRVLSGVFQNFQSVSFTVLLDRLPDVMSGVPTLSDYSPTLSGFDRSGLRRYGTHWDMEALLRVCNGEWDLTDRGKTSNIGILIPSNARLILGPGVNLYGFVGSVTWKDELFSADMVPVRTRLDIVFRRHVEMSAEQAKNSFPGIASDDTSGSGSSGDDSDPNSGGGGGTSDNSAGNPKQAPVPGYNTVTTHYGASGSSWSSGRHTGDDYGLGGIKGKTVIVTRDGVINKIGTAGSNGGWGNWAGNHVVVKTGNVTHGYCHMQSLQAGLRVGAVIKAGDPVGRVGTTGNSTGNHLHYEERVNGSPRKPIWGNK